MLSAVADTSALLSSPDHFSSFDRIFVPFLVIKELDNLKVSPYEKGRRARKAIKHICDAGYELLNRTRAENADEEVIVTALERSAVVVTADVSMSLLAKAMGAEVKLVEPEELSIEDGFFETYSKEIDAPDGSYGILHAESDRLVYVWKDTIKYVNNIILKLGHKTVVVPRGARQTCMAHAILDRDIKLVAATGIPGSGKTFIALASALHLAEHGFVNKVILTVPAEHIGRRDRYGYAPGDMEDKMFHFSRGILDNLNTLRPDLHFKDLKDVQRQLDYVEIQPLYLIRGRNIDNAVIILDEAQNVDVDTMRVLLTRAGENTKIVLCGDVEQRDVLDYNGLVYTIKAFQHTDVSEPLFAHINLIDTKRGRLCETAWNILK